jgi:hypothetical protein
LLTPFAHPVDAQAAALIVAAFAMALAILLFFFLSKSRRIPEMSQHQTLEDFLHLGPEASFPAPPQSVRRDGLRKDLAYQRPYVDRSRIRP